MSRIVTVQGRQLTPSDVETIHQLIAANPEWHRTRLSQELCLLWDWRTETGMLKDMACRTMLRKLERKGLVVLPAARHFGNQRRRIVDVAHAVEPIETDLQEIQPIRLVPVQGRGPLDDLFHCLMDRYHYLECKGHGGEHMKYISFDRHDRPLACLLFGSTAWKTAPRNEFIGWDRRTSRRKLQPSETTRESLLFLRNQLLSDRWNFIMHNVLLHTAHFATKLECTPLLPAAIRGLFRLSRL